MKEETERIVRNYVAASDAAVRALRDMRELVADYREGDAYLRRLFHTLAPHCEQKPTLEGLATQIDNYIAGLTSRFNNAQKTADMLVMKQKCFAHPEADRLDGCVECVAQNIKASRLRAEKAEAEVRHLKNTSREADWQEKFDALRKAEGRISRVEKELLAALASLEALREQVATTRTQERERAARIVRRESVTYPYREGEALAKEILAEPESAAPQCVGHWTQAELDERVRLARENA